MSVLHSFYEEKISENLILSDLEKEILNLIESEEREYYDNLIGEEASADVFLNLTRMRNSLLNWYDFSEGAEILEIGSGYGALTGVLCEKGGHVTAVENNLLHARMIHKRYQKRKNLDIFVQPVEEVIKGRKFDYIVVEGFLELLADGRMNPSRVYEEFLGKLKGALKESGVLLFTAENRYGLKYFCGEPDPYTQISFNGINGCPGGSRAYLFNRQELVDLVEAAGFSCYRFYYPLPDHKLTQAVYSDEYMPKGSIRDRVIPYYLHPEALVAAEDNLYDDLIHNHVLGFFANSFLVECRMKQAENYPVFAAVSTDREEENAFATVIYRNHVVKKKALYAKGRDTLEKMQRNMEDMRRHGVRVIPSVICCDMAEMPYVEQMNFAQYLAKIIREDQKEFERLIELLYQNILKSSAPGDRRKCELPLTDFSTEETGEILKNAYIDMIPYNCFYMDEELVFYDQEFVKENFPAKYVLFRALRYLYLYIPDAEQYISLSHFKEKYEMKKIWQLFEEQEGRFTAQNRNEKELGPFYRWAAIDKTKIYNRSRKDGEKLPEKGEGGGRESVDRKLQNQYEWEKDENLQKIKKARLEIYRFFLKLCETHRLRYCAIYGTLLGAVRHNGFIPWDDDIDIAMPRQDYDRLCEIAQKGEIDPPFFFQTPESDPDCFYGGYGKLRNSNTAEIDDLNKGKNCNKGICIDIFPLDASFAEEKRRKKQIQKITFYQELLFIKVYPEGCHRLNRISKKQKKRLYFISRLFTHNRICRRLYQAMTMCREESGKLEILARYVQENERKSFDEKDFAYSVMLPFEDTGIIVPIGYRNWLKNQVGADYKLYPQKNARKPHHAARYDVERSWLKVEVQEKRRKE